MERFTLFLFVLLFPLILSAQEFKPLLDPTIACSYGSLHNRVDRETNMTSLVDYYFIVEEMPRPKLSFTQLETQLKETIHFSEKELNLKRKMAFQCLVNCKGKAGDYQIISCPNEMTAVCNQILDVLKKDFTEWEAGIQRKGNVDVLIRLVATVDKGKIKVVYNY